MKTNGLKDSRIDMQFMAGKPKNSSEIIAKKVLHNSKPKREENKLVK